MPPGGAVDDGAARFVRRQSIREYLMDVGQLGPGLRGHDHELEVGALGAAVENAQLDAKLVLEVVDDFGPDVGLGGGGETQHRWYRLRAGALPDVTAHVAIVRPEIVTPLGQAVGFVQYPAADFPVLQCPAQRDAAQLLRRDDEDAGVAQAHPL